MTAIPSSTSASSETHRILLVDDHPIVREGLSLLIGSQPDLTICGQAADVAEALQIAETEKPDLAVVDISLKTGSGLDLIRALADRNLQTKILVSSVYDESLYAERVLHAGAMGYINKQEPGKKILEAFRRVLSGKVYLSEKMSERLLRRLVGQTDTLPKPSVHSLSDRELEVFRLIGDGFTTSEIASRLKLSVKTVETYRQRIKEKLELRNAADLARHASRWVLENS